MTSVVQAAYGKYKTLSEAKTDTSADDAVTDKETPTFVRISVDACTFDRVLLYLEHVDRGNQPDYLLTLMSKI